MRAVCVLRVLLAACVVCVVFIVCVVRVMVRSALCNVVRSVVV